MTLVLVGVLVALAVLTWPRRTPVVPGLVPDAPAVPVHPRSPRRRASRADRERAQTVLRLLEAVSSAVEAGVPPAQAVSIAVRTTPVHDTVLLAELDRLAEEGAAGRDLGPVWSELAERHSWGAIAEVGRAWTLSDRLGSPLAEALATATATLRSRLEHERRVHVLVAGPRATMQLLTLLPLGGLALAPVVGVSLSEAYSGPVLVMAGAPGVGLLLAGRLVVARMVRRSTAEQALT